VMLAAGTVMLRRFNYNNKIIIMILIYR